MIQQVFSKPSLVNMISNEANLVFYLSVYPLFHSANYALCRLQTSHYAVIFDFCVNSAS